MKSCAGCGAATQQEDVIGLPCLLSLADEAIGSCVVNEQGKHIHSLYAAYLPLVSESSHLFGLVSPCATIARRTRQRATTHGAYNDEIWRLRVWQTAMSLSSFPIGCISEGPRSRLYHGVGIVPGTSCLALTRIPGTRERLRVQLRLLQATCWSIPEPIREPHRRPWSRARAAGLVYPR